MSWLLIKMKVQNLLMALVGRLLGTRWYFTPRAWEGLGEFIQAWSVNFGVEGAEQPDRVRLVKDLGQGPITVEILRGLYRLGSLQRAVAVILNVDDDKAGEISAHITQVCHAGFPDLAGTYDHSTRWRRG